MRILVLAPHPFYSYRGTPIAVRSVLEVLSKAGHSVTVLTYNEGQDIELPSVKIVRLPPIPGVRGIRPGFSLKKVVSDAVMLRQCAGLMRRERFDLVHAVEESVFIAMAMKRLHGVPFLYDMDSSLVQQMIDRFPLLRALRRPLAAFENAAIRSSSGVLAVCRTLADRAREARPDQLVGTVEDFSLLSARPGHGELLSDTLGPGGPIAMYVGNLESYQGIDLMLEGFRISQRQVPSGRLVVIGGNPKGLGKYRARAKALGLEGQAHFLGPRPLEQLGWFLRQAQILVSPRDKGSNTAMKIYSYLDSGRPLLATRLPTHTQVLDDEIAYLVEPNAQAMGQGLVELMTDETLGRRLGRRARARVRLEFSSSAFERKLATFYTEVQAGLGHVGTRAPAATPDELAAPLLEKQARP